MAKFTEGGYLLAIIKDAGSTQRPDDNKTSWIYVPAKASITGRQLVDVIDCVKENLLGLEDDHSKVKEKFEKEYGEKNLLSTAVETIKSTSNGNLAWRKYGKGTNYQLSDLLGNAIAQKEYGKYEAVCFVDAESGVTVNGQELTAALKPIVTVQPPDQEEGWSLLIKLNDNYVLFDKAIELPEGTEISVVWKKSEYKEVSYTHPVSKDDDNKALDAIAIKDKDKKIILYRSVFDVIDEDGKPVKGYVLKVNGKLFWEEKMEILEEEIEKEIQIEVTMKGYEKCNRSHKINKAQPIHIKLEKHEEESTYILPKDEGEGLSDDATVTIKTRGLDKKMPLKGYKVESDGNKRRIIWDSFALKAKCFFMGVASVFVVALVIVAISAICSSIDNFFSTHDFQLGWPPITEKSTYTIREDGGDGDKGGHEASNAYEEDNSSDVTKSTPDDSIMEATIVYLNNAKWHKDSLEKYPLTKGLFDNMRIFNIDKVISILEQSSIDTVENVKKVLEAAKRCKEEAGDPSRGGTVKYPPQDIDRVITVDKYVEQLSQ